MLYSPINYQGNKSRIVDELKKLIPQDCKRIVEVFCGSAVFSFDSDIKDIVINDIDSKVLDLIRFFKYNSPEDIINTTDKIIKEYNLTNTYFEGKQKYPEEKHEGLSRYNKDSFNKLKQDYNKDNDISKLFVLTIYAFNHFLRFNSKGEYNVPVGKVDFVSSLRDRVHQYCNAIQSKNLTIYNKSFEDMSLYEYLNKNDLVYLDPPYLITVAPYNAFWDESKEKALLNLLDYLHSKGIKFMLSNVIESNGKVNEILKRWMQKYNVHYINRQYLNSSYQKKNITRAIEVVITNY